MQNLSDSQNSFFLPYQKKWILDDSRIKIMEKSRQIGLSWSTAYDLVRRHILEKSGTNSWVSSRDELQAKLFIDDCKKFSDILGLAAKSFCIEKFEDSSESNLRTLAFANGAKINSLSSNADAQAGKRGTRVLDEFALHPDPFKLYSIAYPGITWGGQLQIISTHRGADNFFNKLIEEVKNKNNPKKISLHKVTLQDALEQGLLKKLKQKLCKESEIQDMDEAAYFDYIKNSCADYQSFLQEYMCVPEDENSSFISSAILEKNLYEENFDWRKTPDEKGFFYLGVDVARSNDLSVFWLLEKSCDTLFTRDVVVLKDVSFSEQERILYSFLKHPSLRRVAIDQSGLGRQFAERASERFGQTRIEGVSFTGSIKEMLAYPLKSAFEDCKLRIPNELEIRCDIRSIKKETTITGAIRFSAERSQNGHADRFWALALANYAAKESYTNTQVNLLERKKNNFVW